MVANVTLEVVVAVRMVGQVVATATYFTIIGPNWFRLNWVGLGWVILLTDWPTTTAYTMMTTTTTAKENVHLGSGANPGN